MPHWTMQHDGIRERHPHWFKPQQAARHHVCEGRITVHLFKGPSVENCPGEYRAWYCVAGHWFCGIHQPAAAVALDAQLQRLAMLK